MPERPPIIAGSWNLVLSVVVGAACGIASASYTQGSNSAATAQNTAQIAGMLRQLDTMSDHERRLTAVEQHEEEDRRLAVAIVDHERRITTLENDQEKQNKINSDWAVHVAHIDEQLSYIARTIAHGRGGG